MELTKNIKKLVKYGMDSALIRPEDKIFMINQYLEIFGIDEYDDPDIHGEEIFLPDVLEQLTEEAFERKIIYSDDIVTKDLFDTKLMGVMVSCPSEIKRTFYSYYKESPQSATDYFYEMEGGKSVW